MCEQSRPDFLDLMDSAPQKAFEGFYAFARGLFTRKPPRGLCSLTDEEKLDFFHDVVLHCVRDNFRVLRQYSEVGHAFSGWLYIVIHNRLMDTLRRHTRRKATFVWGSREQDTDGMQFEGRSSEALPDSRAETADLLGIVRECIHRLDEYCQLLIQMAADEYTPKEIVTLLRLPRDSNKQVSDQLRDCRRRLRKLIAGEGLDVTSMMSD